MVCSEVSVAVTGPPTVATAGSDEVAVMTVGAVGGVSRLTVRVE